MAIKQDFYYDSADKKTKIHAVKWIPEIETRAILQIAHGMFEYIDRYDYFARFMAENGILVAGNDHLGHGASVLIEEDRGFFSEGDGNMAVIKDMRNLREMLKEEYEVPYFILGHSMGSFLVRQYVSIYHDMDGALIMGTGYPPYAKVMYGMIISRLLATFKGWRYRSRYIHKLAVEKNNTYFEPSRTRSDWLTRDEKVVDAYINDKRINFIFTLNAFYYMFKGMLYSYDKGYLDKIPESLPLILLSGEKDPLGNFGKDVEKLYAVYKTKLTDVTMKLYKDYRHEILNELDKDKVNKDILSWINKKMT